MLFTFLSSFAASCKHCRAVLITTPMQHFASPDGAFNPSVINSTHWEASGAGCRRIANKSLPSESTNSWRSADILTEHPHHPRVLVVPWHLLTRDWWAAHPGSTKEAWTGETKIDAAGKLILDCSHFCYSPFLYEPLWWALSASLSV